MDEQKYNLEQSLEELGKLLDLSVKETDKTACEALAEKARIIYGQYPKSEDIALRYAKVLVRLSTKQTKAEDVTETIQKINDIYKKFNEPQDIALRYAMALVNLSTKQTKAEEVNETIQKINDIYKKFNESQDIALYYTMALINLSTKQTKAKEFAEIAQEINDIYKKFNEPQDIALYYTMALANLAIKLTKVEEITKVAQEINDIYKKFNEPQDIALHYARALISVSTKQTKAEEFAETTQKIQVIYEKFNEPQDIALYYTMALANLAIKLTKVEEIAKVAQEINDIYIKFNEPQDIALHYARALVSLSAEQTKAEEIAETTQKIQVIYEKFNEPQDIASSYAIALSNLSVEQMKAEEIAETTQKIQVIYEKFNEAQDIAFSYAMALSKLSLEQTNLDKLNDTASKLKKMALNFEKNEEITLYYAEVLTKIITKQQNEEEKLEIIDKLKRLHDRFEQSEEITVQYLTARMDLVKNNQIEQSNLVNDIYQSLESIPSIKILNMLIEILENDEQFKQDQVQISTSNIVKALDKLCFDSSIEEGKDEKEKNLLIRTLKLGIISDTKYDILKSWIEHYGEDSQKINKLIKIYTLVQRIKYELGLKVEDKNRNLKFGHYTSGEALQSILGKEDKAPFSISGKTRLNNANYMNDPEEGVILEDILKLEKRNPLEPSSWFLTSFTSKTDDLAMWSQYGNNAEGVCIVLKENDFARYHSLSDLPWYQKNSDIKISHKMNSSIEFQNNISSNEPNKEMTTRSTDNTQNSEDKHSTPNTDKDYLYRVAYVHYSDEQFNIEETELFTSEEVTRLKGLLVDLKSELRDYKNPGDPFYKKAISDCVEEIRYLFKSVDYKYEEELRILQYSNLNSDNEKIKIDYSPEFGKLYLERKNSIQIGEVIFGPKFPNPEYVTPLLKLLDKNINYRKSTIKFR